VREQQALAAGADALILIAPVFWMGFPAILKGWFERVFAYVFACTLNSEGWRGNLEGRVPLLSQEKALVITPTFFTKAEYDRGWRDAMDTVICDWGLEMAGVREAEHHYLYAALAADDEKRRGYLDEVGRRGYLDEVHALGRGF
jgi:NAD(P)H dehydrogenase (quinone)